jgi:ketopantoate reductase
VNFDPFDVDATPTEPAGPAEAAAEPVAPATPAATPAAVDPFAVAPAAPAAAEAPQPVTPLIKRYTIVHHPQNGYGIVLAVGTLQGVERPRNAVVVGWFPVVSHPITTDQLEPVASQ